MPSIIRRKVIVLLLIGLCLPLGGCRFLSSDDADDPAAVFTIAEPGRLFDAFLVVETYTNVPWVADPGTMGGLATMTLDWSGDQGRFGYDIPQPDSGSSVGTGFLSRTGVSFFGFGTERETDATRGLFRRAEVTFVGTFTNGLNVVGSWTTDSRPGSAFVSTQAGTVYFVQRSVVPAEVGGTWQFGAPGRVFTAAFTQSGTQVSATPTGLALAAGPAGTVNGSTVRLRVTDPATGSVLEEWTLLADGNRLVGRWQKPDGSAGGNLFGRRL